MRDRNGHVLHTPADCPFDHSQYPDGCPVCDGGLVVCKICGKAETELDGPCVPGNGRSTGR